MAGLEAITGAVQAGTQLMGQLGVGPQQYQYNLTDSLVKLIQDQLQQTNQNQNTTSTENVTSDKNQNANTNTTGNVQRLSAEQQQQLGNVISSLTGKLNGESQFSQANANAAAATANKNATDAAIAAGLGNVFDANNNTGAFNSTAAQNVATSLGKEAIKAGQEAELAARTNFGNLENNQQTALMNAINQAFGVATQAQEQTTQNQQQSVNSTETTGKTANQQTDTSTTTSSKTNQTTDTHNDYSKDKLTNNQSLAGALKDLLPGAAFGVAGATLNPVKKLFKF